jgi:5'-3' exonuclease
MGIPKMFRWLTDLYPDILNKELEEGLSADLSVDNFYLDMNGTKVISGKNFFGCTPSNFSGSPFHSLVV